MWIFIAMKKYFYKLILKKIRMMCYNTSADTIYRLDDIYYFILQGSYGARAKGRKNEYQQQNDEA